MSAPLPQALVDHAASALAEALRFTHPADAVVAQYAKRHRALGARDRAQLAEIVFGVLRHLQRVQAVATDANDADALVAAWLSGAWQGGEALDMPDWLLARWPWADAPEASRAMAEAFNQPAPLDLRVNLLRAKRDAVRAALAADGIDSAPGRWSPLALRVVGKPALQRHPLMVDGSIEVQDEGSQVLGLLVGARRGELVVDFCAGAGGKSLQMGAAMRNSGRVHAFDVSAGRLSELSLRAKRAGLSNVYPMAIADERDPRLQRLAGKADRVLVDAPCSGLGTLRRATDLKWRVTAGDIAPRVAQQQSILAAAAQLVKPGGVLVYATCSVLSEENEAVVADFLAANAAFALEPALPLLARQGVDLPGDARDTLHLDPLHHATDGFFAARMLRQG